jgi:RimJ/RimL family protein N-acetyltransferase
VSSFHLSTFDPPLEVPELVIDPLVLRPFALGDLAMVGAAAVDPYIPSITSIPARYNPAEGRAFIERQHDRSADGHGYPFVIARAEAPTQGLGAIGLWLREIESGRASIGYWLLSEARGQHLAAVALGGVVRFAFDVLAIPRLHLFIEPWNIASQCTAESVGFTQEALLRGWERIEDEQRDAYSYVLLRTDFRP